MAGVLAVLEIAGCAGGTPGPTAAVPPPVPVDGVGYVVLSAAITPLSQAQITDEMGKLIGAGAKEIRLGINSPGGDIHAAEGIVAYMQRERAQDGVVFSAYDMQVVASAATYIFLNADHRYAAPRSAFLFHAAGASSSAPMDAVHLREAADRIDAYEKIVLATLKARTRLSDGAAQTYLHRTVVLSADDALRDGIADAIAPYAPPKDARVWVVRTVPPPKPATPSPPPPATP